MILFDLECAKKHRFEGWFKSGDAFDKQAEAKSVECPTCGSKKVRKALSAPALLKGGTGSKAEAIALKMREAMVELKKQVETNCDYVGDRFPEEARRIHYGEAPQRAIRGQASESERRELELVVGSALDAEMGPVVLFGTGGVDIELMKDVALAGAPLDAAEARQLIGRTKAGVKLKGYRGKPALHEASAVKALVGLSNLMADAGQRIASIDVNPFLINTKTGVAVDALIVLNNAAAKSAAGR